LSLEDGEVSIRNGHEYLLALVVLGIVIATYAIAFHEMNGFFSLLVGIFSSLLGAFMIPFGFWGADFAFGVVIGHVKQTNDSRVHVPFLRNYTPLEWWNINWFIVSVGVGFLAIGMFATGYSLWPLLHR